MYFSQADMPWTKPAPAHIYHAIRKDMDFENFPLVLFHFPV